MFSHIYLIYMTILDSVKDFFDFCIYFYEKSFRVINIIFSYRFNKFTLLKIRRRCEVENVQSRCI